jgi:HD-GYP domain-containing protein (c-di-GMP phosphodiesterase class II)
MTIVDRTSRDRARPLCSFESELEDRSRLVGGLLVRCDLSGNLTPLPRGAEDDWRWALVGAGRLLARRIEEVAAAWSEEDDPTDHEVFPGCFAVPIAIQQRRRRLGYYVLILLTADILDAEQLAALCGVARLDLVHTREKLVQTGLHDRNEIGRLGLMMRWTYRDMQSLADGEEAATSFSCQLSEAYEELSLLYNLGRSMRIEQTPDDFIALTCDALLQNLSFRFVAVRLDTEHDGISRFARALHVAGEPNCTRAQLSELTSKLVETMQGSKSQVIMPRAAEEYGWAEPLGQCVLAHPLLRDGRIIGVIIACDKIGDDPDPTTGELKLLDASAGYLQIFMQNVSLYHDQQALFLGTLEALTASIDAKDAYTCGHSQRVAMLSRQLAEAAGFDTETIERIHIAGVVHDVGKIGIREAVLCKAGKLTREEFEEIKQHPGIGARILKDVPLLQDVIPGVLHHHERFAGGGYPNGMGGYDIPVFARVIALADSFDAMSSTRTYRTAMSRADVFKEIYRCSGTQFDPGLVPCFLGLDFEIYDEMVRQHRAGAPDPLSDGEHPAREEAA